MTRKLFPRIGSTVRNGLRSFRLTFVLAVVVLSAVVASAQTPVPISLDTNAIFTSANSWITSLTPVYAVGIGIGIAAAILGFVGVAIIKALRGSGSK